MINVTADAAKWIKIFMQEQKKDPATTGFRVGVRGGGCSGFQYAMMMDAQKPGDHVFEKDGVRVFVDPRSFHMLTGSTLDFLMKYQGAGFTLLNPNAEGACGCGSSVAIKADTAEKKQAVETPDWVAPHDLAQPPAK